MTRPGSSPRRRRLPRFLRRAAALSAAVVLTVVLAQSATSAAFTAQTVDTGNQVSSAASFCLSPGTKPPLYPSEDTASYESSTTTNYGTNVQFGVLSAAGGNVRGFVRFPLPNISGCTITGATLRLYVASPAPGRLIDVYRVDPAAPLWTELGLTWSNQPGTTGTAVTTSSLTGAGWQEWTVTDLVTAMKSGVNNGFLVRDGADGSSPPKSNYYDSKESATPANKPQLVLTWG